MKTLSKAQQKVVDALKSRPSFVHRSERFKHLNSILSNEEYEKGYDDGLTYITHTIGYCYLTTVDALIKKGVLVLSDKREAYILSEAIAELVTEKEIKI